MQGKCHRYLTSRHFGGASCFTGAEDSSGELPSPLLLPPLGLASAFQIPPASLTPGSHSGVPRPASPLSSLLFALLREVRPLEQATTLSYSNQKDLDPVPRLPGPGPSPIPRTASNRMQLLVIDLLPPPSFTRRSGDQPWRIQTHPWRAAGWGREALLQ